MSYVIGSFNIQDFNLTKAFDKLAEIIISENMDVVGIQEVNSKAAVDTFGPFKLVGGLKKGHPDEDEIQGAVNFF